MSDLAHVTSADGTVITFERTGAGHPLILVHGSGADRHRFDPLKPYLTGAFELALVDRRGRGASEDPEDYDIARARPKTSLRSPRASMDQFTSWAIPMAGCARWKR